MSTQSLCPFFFFCHGAEWDIYVFRILTPYQIYDLKIVPVYGCLFIFLVVFFAVQKLFSLILSHLLIFAFVTFAFGVKKKKNHRQDPCWGAYPQHVFSFRSFTVSSLKFKSLIHFEFILVYGRRQWCSFLLHEAGPFPNTIYWRDYPLSFVYSYLLCHDLIDQICMGLFLDSLFCSIDLCVYFYANTVPLWLL